MTPDGILKKLLDHALTPEFMNAMSERIREEDQRNEEWQRQQRECWNKHKKDSYDI